MYPLAARSSPQSGNGRTSGRIIGRVKRVNVHTQPAEYDEALKLQQKIDLELSFAYAKKKLNAGAR